jgi:1,2-diacylglycerol 3-beta-glucosyltransferase
MIAMGNRLLDLPAPTEATPMSWRIAAVGLLIAGFFAGERAVGVAARRTTVVAAGLGFAIWAVIVAASSRAPRLDPAATGPPSLAQDSPPLPPVDVVIPARDEASAMPQLLRDLGAQDHRDLDGRPRFTVIIVDDRSTDGTAMVAAAAADRAGLGRYFHIVSRPPGARPDGKGAALAAVPRSLLGGAAIVVLDADARIAPDFLRRAAAWVAGGTPAITARRRVRHGEAGHLAAAQAAEQTMDGLQLRGRAAFGGFGELRGNGMVLTPAVLYSAGGWPAGSLTEDLELSMRLAAQGVPVAWGSDLVAWEAPTATIAALCRQRLRWAEGSVRRFFLLLLVVLASEDLPTAAKIDLVGSAAQLVLPQFLAGVALGGIRQRDLTVPVVLGGVYVGVATGLTWVALGQEARFDGRVMPARARLARSALGGSIGTLWLIAVPLAQARIVIQKGPTTFAKTRDRLL